MSAEPAIKEAGRFHRNLFAALCFIFFGFALATDSPYGFLGAAFCGALSRTAVRKKWPDPPFADKLSSMLANIRKSR